MNESNIFPSSYDLDGMSCLLNLSYICIQKIDIYFRFLHICKYIPNSRKTEHDTIITMLKEEVIRGFGAHFLKKRKILLCKVWKLGPSRVAWNLQGRTKLRLIIRISSSCTVRNFLSTWQFSGRLIFYFANRWEKFD